MTSQKNEEPESNRELEALIDAKVSERVSEVLVEAEEDSGGYTKREILQGLALIGTGAAVGSVSAYGSVGRAAAATGTGTIGTQANPLDAIYANQVGDSTEPVQSINTNAALFKGKPWHDVTAYGAEGDGVTNDSTAIQSAIDAAGSAGGGIVFLPEGDYYNPDGLSFSGIDNVDLRGVGAASILRTDDTTAHGINMDNCAHCVVDSLRLVGNSTQAAEDAFQAGIHQLEFVDFCTVSNCLIEDWGYDGAHTLRDSAGNAFISNHIRNTRDDGLNPGGHSTGVNYGAIDTIVHGNLIEGCGTTGIHISTDAERTIVSNNTIKNCVANGIDFYISRESIIESNVIVGCDMGIATAFGDETNNFGHKIADNLIKSPAGPGIQITLGKNHTVDGNIIKDPPNFGVAVSAGGSAPAEGVSVTNNRVEGGTRAINVQTKNAPVDGNTVKNASEYGIILSTGTAVDMNGSVSNNTVEGGCTGAAYFFGNFQHVAFSGNTCRNITGDSIAFGSSVDWVSYTGNVLEGAFTMPGVNSVEAGNIER